MGYALMVFDSEKAPVYQEEFMAWCEKQTGWSGDHSYNDVAVT